MTRIKKSALVPYSTAQMFELVAGIEQYPQFLPWCKSTVIHWRTDQEVEASVLVAKGGMEYSFTTRNHLVQDHQIAVHLVQGPLSRLQGQWRFEGGNQAGSIVSLELEIEFKSKLATLTVGPLLQKLADTFMVSFCQRARLIYGT